VAAGAVAAEIAKGFSQTVAETAPLLPSRDGRPQVATEPSGMAICMLAQIVWGAESRTHACNAALAAAIAVREGVAELKKRRSAEGKPVTDMYLGLHVGKVFYGNVGSRERLDFTVLGPAVNEASRIAAMCRSVDQPVLMSAAFANVGDIKRRLISVGRYALRGVAHPQELFTFDPDAWAELSPERFRGFWKDY
jgi:class 3 adenylate cyclase